MKRIKEPIHIRKKTLSDVHKKYLIEIINNHDWLQLCEVNWAVWRAENPDIDIDIDADVIGGDAGRGMFYALERARIDMADLYRYIDVPY